MNQELKQEILRIIHTGHIDFWGTVYSLRNGSLNLSLTVVDQAAKQTQGEMFASKRLALVITNNFTQIYKASATITALDYMASAAIGRSVMDATSEDMMDIYAAMLQKVRVQERTYAMTKTYEQNALNEIRTALGSNGR